LVASPKQSGSSPLAMGSSVPECPALAAEKSRLAACSAEFEDIPVGLSRSNTPSTRRQLFLTFMTLQDTPADDGSHDRFPLPNPSREGVGSFVSR